MEKGVFVSISGTQKYISQTLFSFFVKDGFRDNPNSQRQRTALRGKYGHSLIFKGFYEMVFMSHAYINHGVPLLVKF